MDQKTWTWLFLLGALITIIGVVVLVAAVAVYLQPMGFVYVSKIIGVGTLITFIGLALIVTAVFFTPRKS